MTAKSKDCSDVMKKHFNKEIVIRKKDVKDFENFTKCWVLDNVFFDGDVKVMDRCH